MTGSAQISGTKSMA